MKGGAMSKELDKAKSFLENSGQARIVKGLKLEEKVLRAIICNCPDSQESEWLKFPRLATMVENNQGADLVIETWDMGKLYLRVKSSDGALRRFRGKRHHTMVEPVVIKNEDDLETVWEKVRQTLGWLRDKISKDSGRTGYL
jgi:hypothetical protein